MASASCPPEPWRHDYGTEFGPTNVAIRAVSIAVELGDAGQAIELVQAHSMRRQIGEALHMVTSSSEPGESHPRKSESITSRERSPAICPSSPGCGHDPNSANCQNDSESCHDG